MKFDFGSAREIPPIEATSGLADGLVEYEFVRFALADTSQVLLITNMRLLIIVGEETSGGEPSGQAIFSFFSRAVLTYQLRLSSLQDSNLHPVASKLEIVFSSPAEVLEVALPGLRSTATLRRAISQFALGTRD